MLLRWFWQFCLKSFHMWFYCVLCQSIANCTWMCGKVVLTKWLCVADEIIILSCKWITWVSFPVCLAGSQYYTSLVQDYLFNCFFQVLQWKAQQEEAAKLEAAVAARRKEKEDEKERLRKEQQMIRRAQEKEKVWETFIRFCICSCVQLPLKSLTDLTTLYSCKVLSISIEMSEWLVEFCYCPF